MKRIRTLPVVAALTAALSLPQARGASYTWIGNNLGLWSVAGNWSGDAAGYPNGSTAAVRISGTSGDFFVYLPNGAGYAVGSLLFKPATSWYKTSLCAAYGGNATLSLGGEGMAEALVSAETSATATLGDPYSGHSNTTTFVLASPVRFGNTGSYSGSIVISQYQTKLTGSNSITVNATGSGSLTLAANSALDTHAGTWYVDGAKSVLQTGANGNLGPAANGVVLRNNGTLRLTGTGFVLARTVSGNGLVNSPTTTLTVADGGVLSPGENGIGALAVTTSAGTLGFTPGGKLAFDVSGTTCDSIAVTGSVSLNNAVISLANAGAAPTATQTWTLLAASGGLSGSWAAFTAPDGNYTLSVTGSVLQATYTPPPPAEPQMGVYLTHGDEAAIVRYETWVGRPLDCIVDFGPNDNWAAMTGTQSGYGLNWAVKQWTTDYRPRIVWSLPMLPKSGATLAAGATGAYDGYWRATASTLVAYGYQDCTVRLGWEFNAGWFAWSAVGKAADYRNYWKKIVLAMRSVPGANFKFNWCGNDGDGGMNPADAYPDADYAGDYVDEIGVDLYDQCWASNTYPIYQSDFGTWTLNWKRNNAWSTYSSWGTYNLNWWANLAATKGKPLTIPEWGTAIRPGDGVGLYGYGGGDNTIFITKMHDWMVAHGVKWHSYFQEDNSEIHSKLFEDAGNEFPAAAATFLELFGP